MVERRSLRKFLPEEDIGARIEVREDLTPVIERISEVVPSGVLWEFFSSSPTETGGRVVFPYLRVDAQALTCRNYIELLKNHGEEVSPEKRQEWYLRASQSAFKTLLWVEVGFQGLANLARHPVSVNWTSAVGHFVSDKEREEGIMSGGKKLFESCLGEFVSFRRENRISDDCFSQYGAEYLLEKFS